jgi:hypothetical protein
VRTNLPRLKLPSHFHRLLRSELGWQQDVQPDLCLERCWQQVERAGRLPPDCARLRQLQLQGCVCFHSFFHVTVIDDGHRERGHHCQRCGDERDVVSEPHRPSGSVFILACNTLRTETSLQRHRTGCCPRTRRCLVLFHLLSRI